MARIDDKQHCRGINGCDHPYPPVADSITYSTSNWLHCVGTHASSERPAAADIASAAAILIAHHHCRNASIDFGADSSLAREYELEFDSQYIPLNIYTREVDYPDVQVQVSRDISSAAFEPIAGDVWIGAHFPPPAYLLPHDKSRDDSTHGHSCSLPDEQISRACSSSRSGRRRYLSMVYPALILFFRPWLRSCSDAGLEMEGTSCNKMNHTLEACGISCLPWNAWYTKKLWIGMRKIHVLALSQ